MKKVIKIKKIVLTGRGILNPLGLTLSEFRDGLFLNKNAIKQIEKFNVKNGKIQVAGQLSNVDYSFIPKRLNHKIDTFIRYALIASGQAIKESSLYLTNEDLYRIGVFVGNNSGGWDISERGFNELYNKGIEYINPWQATAWFPAAPQGFISIVNKIHGYSKSFVADRASGAMALKFGVDSIKSGLNDVIICGGSEAPVTPLATICYAQTGDFYQGTHYQKGTMPFLTKERGEVLGEGSAFLVLEEKEHAIKRNASIIAEIEGVVTNFGNNIDAYTQCVERLLEQHNLEYSDIDLYIPEGCAEEKSDNIEAKFIDKKLAKQTLITVPKAAYGSLYGASTSTDIVSASIFMEEAKVSRTIGDYETIRNINILRNNTKKRIQRVLIMSRSREGSNVAILLRKN